jgi:hypothetical protein
MPQEEATPLPKAWCNIFMIHTSFFCLQLLITEERDLYHFLFLYLGASTLNTMYFTPRGQKNYRSTLGHLNHILIVETFFSPGFCRFGSQCVDAHSAEELREWKDRFEFRQKKAHKAAKMYGKSFADVVLEKLSAAKNKESVRSFLKLYEFTNFYGCKS